MVVVRGGAILFGDAMLLIGGYVNYREFELMVLRKVGARSRVLRFG